MNRLLNHRVSHQRSIFRMETSVQAFHQNSPSSALESSLKLLEEYWLKFQSVQLNVEGKVADGDLENAIQEMKKTEASYLKLKRFLNGRQRDQHGRSNRNANAGEGNVKLPKLEVPTFDGSFSTWVTFRDLFLSMVGSKTTMLLQTTQKCLRALKSLG